MTNIDQKILPDLNLANAAIVEEMLAKYQKDSSSVDPSWLNFFPKLENAPLQERSYTTPNQPSNQPSELRIQHLINAYRLYGHLFANANPLNSETIALPQQLSLERLGFLAQDLTETFPSCRILPSSTAKLQEIIAALEQIYCKSMGLEYMHLQNPELEAWIQARIEPTQFHSELTIEQKRMILQQLNKSELLESFLHTKYPGQKRFSLEGGETLIPMLQEIIDTGASLGVQEFFIGMAHRGRLNVLTNILNKSYAEVFSEFEEGYIPDSFAGSGDVKYHKGYSSEITTNTDKRVQISVAPNPSHLEAVDPVIEGQVRGRQVISNDEEKREKVIPLLVHGDAALAGQGVVYETLQLSRLQGYSTGGTIHLVINNQVGFTALPQETRSTRYCTDIAHAFGSPIFHVNAEDPEACVKAAHLAMQIRQIFHCDVFIDLNCYRKYGHNEGDEPAFTQPLEYQIIRQKKPIREIYRDELISKGILEKALAEGLEAEFKNSLQEALKMTRATKENNKNRDSTQKIFQNYQESLDKQKTLFFKPVATGVPKNTLQKIASLICTIPTEIAVHAKLQNLLKERLAMVSEEADKKPIDWGMAELLAYGSLLWEGTAVRLTGQDSCRGTFSHRHAIWVDQAAKSSYSPLNHIKKGQGRFEVFNSPLSEYAALGFEFGYSVVMPNALIVWEAQFGDFGNGAQITIDQFISTSEQKWAQKSGLVLLLPHGYEGQGPEHSSARVERFLSLAGDYNMRVVNPTTPGQLFHLLRSQVLGPLHKPLIVFTPKGLLRHPACISSLEDLTTGTFQEILDDPNISPVNAQAVRQVVLCSGRIYYDLISEREKRQASHLAIARIEQLYPLDDNKLSTLLARYQGATSYSWVQEEPKNMGAWRALHEKLQELLPPEAALRFVGRACSASPAAGSYALHKEQHNILLKELFG